MGSLGKSLFDFCPRPARKDYIIGAKRLLSWYIVLWIKTLPRRSLTVNISENLDIFSYILWLMKVMIHLIICLLYLIIFRRSLSHSLVGSQYSLLMLVEVCTIWNYYNRKNMPKILIFLFCAQHYLNNLIKDWSKYLYLV